MTIMAWCPQFTKMVEQSRITWLRLPSGNRRRICEECKSKSLDRRRAVLDSVRAALLQKVGAA